MAFATGLGVAQLLGIVGGFAVKIKEAVVTAKRNKDDCKYLGEQAEQVSVTVHNLPRDKELAPPLARLSSTLKEAHDLVMSCQKLDTFKHKAKQLVRANSYAYRFKEIKAKIDSDLSLIQVASITALTRRLDQIILHVKPDSRRMMAQGSSSSGSVKTKMVVPHVSSVSDDHPRMLTRAEIEAATNNLADVLGEGRSGKVYKGRLLHHGGRVREVAVKELKKNGRLGMEVAFVAELEILFPLRHDHIACLVGWCAEEGRRMFVYDHMSNGTLRDHLLGVHGHGRGSPVASSWRGRVEVLLGAARALQHLHHSTAPPVIHRNVTSSNILLDANWSSHLSDFGQALLQEAGDHGGLGQLVPEAIGTFGYLDPEYCSTMRVSPASDVYSFGVVTLEALTGRPPVSSSGKGNLGEVPVTMVSYVLPVIQNGKLRDVLDGRPALVPTPGQLEALELVANTAMLCLWPHGKGRPAMSKVVANLDKALGIIRSEGTNLLW